MSVQCKLCKKSAITFPRCQVLEVTTATSHSSKKPAGDGCTTGNCQSVSPEGNTQAAGGVTGQVESIATNVDKLWPWHHCIFWLSLIHLVSRWILVYQIKVITILQHREGKGSQSELELLISDAIPIIFLGPRAKPNFQLPQVNLWKLFEYGSGQESSGYRCEVLIHPQLPNAF